jgi:hypothetical protein
MAFFVDMSGKGTCVKGSMGRCGCVRASHLPAVPLAGPEGKTSPRGRDLVCKRPFMPCAAVCPFFCTAGQSVKALTSSTLGFVCHKQNSVRRGGSPEEGQLY